MAASERLAAIDDALPSGRRDAAIALLDEVIADESVPGFIRRQARRERADVLGEADK